MILKDSETESIVRLDHLYVDRISFLRSAKSISPEELKIKFRKSYKFNDAHTSCTVSLGCVIKSHDTVDATMELEVNIVGKFFCNDDSLERRENLLTKNTLSILFPYLRTQITQVTAQPDMSPIILQAMNIEAVFDTASET